MLIERFQIVFFRPLSTSTANQHNFAGDRLLRIIQIAKINSRELILDACMTHTRNAIKIKSFRTCLYWQNGEIKIHEIKFVYTTLISSRSRDLSYNGYTRMTHANIK